MTTCRFCKQNLSHSFCNLGSTPLSNAYLTKEQLSQEESFYPLHAFVCEHCLLVQLEEFQKPEQIFSDYAYFSSYSTSWLKHAQEYTHSMIKRFDLNNKKQVVEIASNDGYLLQFFKEKEIPVLGIEPAANVAMFAEKKGIPTLVEFFGKDCARNLVKREFQADLLLGNNVLAHVPNINDFVEGMKILLKNDGLITMEFPHLDCLIRYNQFDTIYHEHFSYFSFLTVEKIFNFHGLKIFDVDQLSTHGGSLRIYAAHSHNNSFAIHKNVEEMKLYEKNKGYDLLETYLKFPQQIEEIKNQIQNFILKVQKDNKTIVGYGAPAKGNTLLNFCKLNKESLEYTVDISPHKQGKYLPGTKIPIYSPEMILKTKPDYLFILPWNLKEEVITCMKCIREWGGKFVVPIPQLEVIS